MSYYFLFVILFIVVAYFIKAYKERDLKSFSKSTAVLVVSALIAIAINSSNLYHTYRYSQESTRGKSELVINNNNNDKGVDKAYITQWSYGIRETLTLLIPNSQGGASKALIENELAMEKANPKYYTNFAQFTQYFGEQPFTAGPVYVGAFIMFLFFVALFIVKGPIKWALFGATLFSIILAWGKNFMPITSFFIDYIPLYDKFRAVSSILVIAEFTIPLLAIFGLKQLLNEKNSLQKNKKPLLIAFMLTGFIALIGSIFPEIIAGDFITNNEILALSQTPANISAPFIENLTEVRSLIVKSDALRSLIVILIGLIILFFFHREKINKLTTILLILALSVVDLWGVNKRYLNDDMFVPKTQLAQEFKQTEADKYILQDRDLNYRVLNFTTSTFNENNTSFWHKSIGGYNAAKLRRYQELIDYYIQPEMQNIIKKITKTEDEYDPLHPTDFPILNMLNTKYFILGQTKEAVIRNPFTLGNAWFIENQVVVESANREIEELGLIDPLRSAVINEEFAETSQINSKGKGEITLTSYEPNLLTYQVNCQNEGLALFSEIYYPGWKAYIDGVELPVMRANYVLRAVNLPEGEYNIKFEFKPTSLKYSETIAYTGLILILLLFIALGYKAYKTY